MNNTQQLSLTSSCLLLLSRGLQITYPHKQIPQGGNLFSRDIILVYNSMYLIFNNILCLLKEEFLLDNVHIHILGLIKNKKQTNLTVRWKISGFKMAPV